MDNMENTLLRLQQYMHEKRDDAVQPEKHDTGAIAPQDAAGVQPEKGMVTWTLPPLKPTSWRRWSAPQENTQQNKKDSSSGIALAIGAPQQDKKDSSSGIALEDKKVPALEPAPSDNALEA